MVRPSLLRSAIDRIGNVIRHEIGNEYELEYKHKEAYMSRIVSKYMLLVGAILFLGAVALHAGSLEKRSRVELRLGFWSQGGKQRTTTQVGVHGVETTTNGGSGMIAMSYGRWLQENLSVHFTFAASAGEVSTRVGSSGVSTRNVGVYSLLLGVRYYLPASSFDTSLRPYLTASVGPYVADEAKTEVDSQIVVESQTLTSFGSNLGGGMDFVIGRNFLCGVNVGYNLMTDFSEIVGGKDNYSGPEFSVGISYIFGKGVQP